MGKYLSLFGFAIVIVGIVAGYVANEWIPIPLGIMVGGGVIFLSGLLFATRGFWQQRSTGMGINALVATIALITIIGLLNFLGVRYGKTIDLTENNLYTLAPQSKQLVENLEKPLTVWVFQSPPSSENERLLKNYQKYSENFKFKFVDPQTNIGKVQEFGVESYGEVYLEYGTKNQFVQQANEVEPISEVRLTSAIKNIQRDRVSFVYFLQGHGEPSLEETQGGFSQAVASLQQQGYQVQPFNFAEENSLPRLANTVLVIASPQQELFPGEMEAIENYLAEGGSLLLLLDPESNPGLESVLDTWGINLDNRVIVDASGQGQVLGFNIATALVTRYGDHPITNPFSNGITVYPLARPVDVVEKEGVEATPLAYTNEASWAESDTTTEQVQYNPERDRAGPLVLGFALNQVEISTKNTQENNPNETDSTSEETTPEENNQEEIETAPTSEETTPEEKSGEENETKPETSPQPNVDSRVVIFGDSDFARNGLFIQQLNGDMFLNSIDWLANVEETSLALRPKEETNRRINLTPEQAAILSRTAIGIVPLFGLILAIISWLRRR